ncbi:carbohydrate ABC transporter permease [Paenibacillus sacheonensis]|uniref:ABC transporter permease subunit n=1 Tax=Paenibacillus sacheonensis TaxID=742054 RepID=A0A7X4YQ41_9BACL|nr:carbohydrate ABC transporter permease [Paenibacillus sacheonensis]MBM7566210.1 putative aldouronate transport system permease protein [Paenibacillus sacheonensis]NBC70418.1 ABC transporter permease subunit [Paenibacillus sacheonensis]
MDNATQAASPQTRPTPRKRGKLNMADAVIHFILAVLTLATLLPFYNVVLMSFSTSVAVSKQMVYLIPTAFDLSAYGYILHEPRFLKALMVTLFVTGVGTSVNMLVTITGAYVLSKSGFPGRKIVMGGIIFTMFFNGGLIPFYLTMKNFHLINNLLVMVLPVAVNTFYMIICIAFFRTLPGGLEESAKIDGANDIQVLYKVVIPISMPMLATITLFYAVDRWNEWWYGVLFMTNVNLLPMQALLRELLTNYQQVLSSITTSVSVQNSDLQPEMLKMAVLVVSTLPIACLYPFLQKYFAKGVMIGSIKG